MTGLHHLVVGAALLTLSAQGVAQSAIQSTRDKSTVLMSESEGGRKFQEEYGYNDAIVTPDGTIYLSGVVVGLRPGETDLEAAFDRAYDRIGNTLKRAGADWGDVVDITSFHTDLTSQLKPMSVAQKKHIKPPFASWSAIQVARLVPDRGITEIKIVAKKSRD